VGAALILLILIVACCVYNKRRSAQKKLEQQEMLAVELALGYIDKPRNSANVYVDTIYGGRDSMSSSRRSSSAAPQPYAQSPIGHSGRHLASPASFAPPQPFRGPSSGVNPASRKSYLASGPSLGRELSPGRPVVGRAQL